MASLGRAGRHCLRGAEPVSLSLSASRREAQGVPVGAGVGVSRVRRVRKAPHTSSPRPRSWGSSSSPGLLCPSSDTFGRWVTAARQSQGQLGSWGQLDGVSLSWAPWLPRHPWPYYTQLAAWLPTACVPGCLFAGVGFQRWGLVRFKTLPLPPESPLHIPVSLMYMEKEPLPSAKPKLGQVGKKSGSFPSWLPTPGTENVPGFLTTGESERKRQ